MSQYTKDKANDTQGGRLTGADIQKEFGQQILSITCSTTWAFHR
ncbi:hypothetical protein QYZ43_01830 [Vibrio parahaemolyticus]|nr:hypothetical protein [Vibrio parahaemolyticus]MDN4704890.1 hypothetical protein [Vibrio parahaemolyticus]MDN4712861.1 hypothetical protein [Vibrio parahaemolyticus]MDN4716803.1 hypothetical protein [Vibrio parahaemolyticus]MDN4722513.1 hypothetical protein [Vibrio parahaemolyticus]MDN4724226.1 hypothetical protein [Vibrio parahaemolyticus]